MASERQRPTILMRSGSTWAQSRAMAPPARRERDEISEGRRPKAGPR